MTRPLTSKTSLSKSFTSLLSCCSVGVVPVAHLVSILAPRLGLPWLGLVSIHCAHSITLGVLLLIWTNSGEMTRTLTSKTSLSKSFTSLFPCCLVRNVPVAYLVTILAPQLGLPCLGLVNIHS